MYQFGSQFDNTYILKPEQKSERGRKIKEHIATLRQYQQGGPLQSDPSFKFETSEEQPKENIEIFEHPRSSEAKKLGIPVRKAGEEQGMLFPPEFYTRTRMDPTVRNYAQQVEGLFDWGNIPKNDRTKVVRELQHSTMSLDQLKNPENLKTGMVVKKTQRNVLGGYRAVNPESRTKQPNELMINFEQPLSGPTSHTLSHELGHRMQHSASAAANRSMASWIELKNKSSEKHHPMLEGGADAIGERYGIKRNARPTMTAPLTTSTGDVRFAFEKPRHSSDIDYRLNTEQRARDLRQSMDETGYGVDFPGWKDNIDKALYAFTRLHVGLHGEKAFEQLPNLDQLNWEYNYTQDTPDEYGKANHRMAKYLALGKLIHENKGLESGLAKTPYAGLADTAMRAASDYRTHLENLATADEIFSPDKKKKHAEFVPYPQATPGQLNYFRMIPEVKVNQEALPGILEGMPKRTIRPIKIDKRDKPESVKRQKVVRVRAVAPIDKWFEL